MKTVSRHKFSNQFVSSGLFEGLNNFAELEARIAALPTAQERGDAFEVFAEAYLASQKLHEIDEIWPDDAVPLEVSKQLGLPSQDMGVDGVFRTLEGKLAAYQVKFRTSRPSLSWREISTIFGLADKADLKVLFTNCDEIANVTAERTNFYCVRGSDLDRLTSEDFKTIENWLQGSFIEQQVKTPRPHQAEALEAILTGFKSHDRVTSVMACGTGKTLTSLWLAEQLGSKRILVLVPSLALIRQTLHEWLKETSWDKPRFQAVCSDPTVTRGGDDAMVVRQADLDFPVSTNPDDVKAFLQDQTDGVQVVFSTYQSAHVVGDAIDGLFEFDLGIFDEAHKTAGREGAKFGFALEDENIPISKRVFLTATPRHYDVGKRDKEGDKKLVYSMDVPETYGPIAYTLSFADAAAQGIICDYKVVISVVTSEMLNADLLKHGEVLIDGDPVNAKTVANQIALQQACEKHDLKKVFSFHSNVASAKDFTGETSSSIKTHLPNHQTLHVNGSMPTALREKVMQAFKNADRAVISNARCLTEGVDVPAVDVVAFLSPRKSKVDIVQATGRAMRKADGKERGYILLPLFVETQTGETEAEALERTGFDEAWNVLQAMQEQDATLADIIRNMRVERGKTGGFDDAELAERVEVLGPEISLDALRSGIATQIVDKLGISWDERFGELITFREKFGHCNVPITWSENPQLASWVVTQRSRKDQLTIKRIDRLVSIGFDWDPFLTIWESMFSELHLFTEEHGHPNVPQNYPDNQKLASWVHTQRGRRRKKILDPAFERRLDALGLNWEPRTSNWEPMFEELCVFKDKNDHCDVPAIFKENRPLGIWVRNVRRRKHELTKEQQQKLETIGFVWDLKAKAWNDKYDELRAFQKKHGHCNVPRKWIENPKLASWASNQRTRRDARSPDEIARLDAIGFEWERNVFISLWDEKLTALLAFRKEFGHCNVPQRWEENRALASWVNNQRNRKRKGILTDTQVESLDAVGFVWEPTEFAWEEMFELLVAFRNRHGHCNVPARWPENVKLANWVVGQRSRGQRLKAEHIKRLDDLGFEWDMLSLAWETMFSQLLVFKNNNGHTNVPNGYCEDNKLYRWCNTQRGQKRKNQLNAERIRRLNELGFEWER